MAKTDLERITDEKIARGGVLARVYFDMQHKEKDKLQPLLVDLINEHLLKERGVVYCYGVIEEPFERDKVFVTSATITVLFENFFAMVGIVFHYAPAGIEIMRPEKDMKFQISELQSMLMELSQISVDYSKYILEKVLKPEDMKTITEELENRALIGKRFLEKQGKEKEEKKDG